MWGCARTGRVSRVGLAGWWVSGPVVCGSGWVLAGSVWWSPAFGEGSALPGVGVFGGEEGCAAGGLAAGGAAEAGWSSGGGGVDRGGAPLAGADRHGGLVLTVTGFVTWGGQGTCSLGVGRFRDRCGSRNLWGLRVGLGRGGGEFDDRLRCGEVEFGQQVAYRFGQFGALAEQAGGSGEGAHVQALEVTADGGPGLAGRRFDDAHEEQGEPAQRDVGADAFFEAVVDRSEVDDLFHVPPTAFDLEELLVADRDVLGGQVRVGGAQQVLAVEVRLGLDRLGIDAQQAAAGDAQVAVQAGFGGDDP